MSCIILKKSWSVISKLFLLNSIFHYISNWSKVLEFYLTSFFNMKSWRVKFRNLLGNFPVHYAALYINRTINNICMTLLMALHHTHDGFWYFFLHATRATLIPGTLWIKSTLNQPTLNQQATSYPSPQYLIDQIQIQKPIQVVATDQMPDHSYRI